MARRLTPLITSYSSSRRYTTRPHPSIDRIIRVNHAGERGADRIYAGQMAVLGNTSSGPVVKVSHVGHDNEFRVRSIAYQHGYNYYGYNFKDDINLSMS